MTVLRAAIERAISAAAPIDDVWEVVGDPERLGDLMPDVERYEKIDDETWSWMMFEQRRFGQRFRPSFTVRYELEPPERLTFHHVGDADGDTRAGGEIRLVDEGSATTVSFRFELEVDVPVPSIVAGPARRLISEEIRRLTDGFLRNVRATVA